MKRRRIEPEPAELAAEFAVTLARQDLKTRRDVVVAIPAHQRFDFADLFAPQPGHAVEVRIGEVLRHQSNGVVAKLANHDPDGIAGQILQHSYPRDGIRVGRGDDAIDEVRRRKEMIGGIHTLFPAQP